MFGHGPFLKHLGGERGALLERNPSSLSSQKFGPTWDSSEGRETEIEMASDGGLSKTLGKEMAHSQQSAI